MSRWLPEMTSTEVEELGRRPVVIPFGSLEQHGAHLPLDTDSAIAESMARTVGDLVDGLVAPGLSYGYRSQPASGGGESFRATTSLSGEGLCRATGDILDSFARHGYDELVLVNGHYENAAFIIEAATLTTHRHDVRIVILNWWELLAPERLDVIFDGEFPGWAAEHAGIAETSLMMHLHPDRVVADLISPEISRIVPPTYTTLPERPELVDPSGVLRTAHGSSANIGRSIFADVINASRVILGRELGSVPDSGSAEPAE
jgi:creatinine amidohydrolase